MIKCQNCNYGIKKDEERSNKHFEVYPPKFPGCNEPINFLSHLGEN